MLHINDITYRIAGRTLFDRATVALPKGARIGLVGRNGAGKSTLLRIICGEIDPEAGSISKPANTKIGYIAQEAPEDECSPFDFVLNADTERAALLAESETTTDPDRISEIYLRLADIDAYTAETRAHKILVGLGFDEEDQKRPCFSFSGGWRNRIALAASIFTQPDLLILDEPTNYLDLESVIWLQDYIARYPNTILLVSHDRDFLNACVSVIVHLELSKLNLYSGDYDSFERQYTERRDSQSKMIKRQDSARERIQSYVARFRSNASKARQAQSRLKQLARMKLTPPIIEQHTQPFLFPDPQKKLEPPLLEIHHAFVQYEANKTVLSNVNFRLDPGDRIALLGSNGSGKSTLAKLIAGKLKPLTGQVVRHRNLEIGYFSQHQLDELIPSETPFWHLYQIMSKTGHTESQIRACTARIGLDREKMDTPVSNLSGGEKVRLLLGLAAFNGPQILILDEPTNHLDIDSRQMLAQALAPLESAIILISHDRYLIDSCADQLWRVHDGKVTLYHGDIDDYRADILGNTSPSIPRQNSKQNSSSKKKTQRL